MYDISKILFDMKSFYKKASIQKGIPARYFIGSKVLFLNFYTDIGVSLQILGSLINMATLIKQGSL
jgi:hypothetical protein